MQRPNTSHSTEVSTSIFRLFDARTDTLLGVLSDGEELVVGADVDLDRVNIVAYFAESLQAESVGFNLNGRYSLENIEPYAVFGDKSGDFRPGSVSTGINTISADAFALNKGQGDVLSSSSIEFLITQQV